MSTNLAAKSPLTSEASKRLALSKRLWLFTLTGLCAYGITLWVQPREFTRRILVGQNDFMQLYIGARLSGSEAIYSRPDNEKLQIEFGGFQSDSIRYSRPPFYAVLLRPLILLPYTSAYWTFQTVSVIAFVLFLRT